MSSWRIESVTRRSWPLNDDVNTIFIIVAKLCVIKYKEGNNRPSSVYKNILRAAKWVWYTSSVDLDIFQQNSREHFKTSKTL